MPLNIKLFSAKTYEPSESSLANFPHKPNSLKKITTRIKTTTKIAEDNRSVPSVYIGFVGNSADIWLEMFEQIKVIRLFHGNYIFLPKKKYSF